MECVPLTGTLAVPWSDRFGWYSNKHSNQTSSLPVRTYACIYTRTCTCICIVISIARTHMLMRDAEGRKKEASKVIQTIKQSNTAHTMYMF